MRTKLLFTLLLAGWCALACTAQNKIRVHTLGDSTMEQQDPNIKDQRGWPQLLQPFFTENVLVMNHGKSGASTKTYYKEGFWTRAKATIRPGDYVLIQFGHNDGKHGGADGEVGTAAADSFKIYLSRFVDEVRELKAHPVLVTPVVRRMFHADGTLSRRGKHDLGEDKPGGATDTVTYNYPYQMKVVADSLRCPLIDMTTSTARLVTALGSEESTRMIYDLPKDGTHFGASGAVLFSRLAAQELKAKQILDTCIVLPVTLAVNPGEIKMDNLYIGTHPVRVFDVCCLGTDNAQEVLRLSASQGFLLSTDEQGVYTPTLTLPYTLKGGLSVFKVFVKTSLTRTGAIQGEITLNNGRTTQKLPIKGTCIPLGDNQPVSATYKLFNHSKPATEGAILGLSETWSGMEMLTFVRPRELGISDPELKYYNTKVQCNQIIGGQWPGNEIDVVYSRYVQLGVEAIKGSTLHINGVQLTIGGGTCYRIVCSKTADFAEAFTLGEWTGEGNAMVTHQLKASQTLEGGERLYIRIYPWSQTKTMENYLCLHNIQISGTQTGQ